MESYKVVYSWMIIKMVVDFNLHCFLDALFQYFLCSFLHQESCQPVTAAVPKTHPTIHSITAPKLNDLDLPQYTFTIDMYFSCVGTVSFGTCIIRGCSNWHTCITYRTKLGCSLNSLVYSLYDVKNGI